jgi:hypothetical protein
MLKKSKLPIQKLSLHRQDARANYCLMRLYESLGFIPMGDNEVVLVTNPMFTWVK